jgi:branched-subunit amino acid transport protein
MNDLVVLLLLGLASWVMRVGLLVLLPASRLPAAVRASLDHLAPAVLAAILVLDLGDSVTAAPGGGSAIATLAAGGVIGIAAWRLRNTALVTVVALVAVVLLDVILG